MDNVTFIGECVELNNSYIALEYNDEIFKFYFQNDENISDINLDEWTKIIGYLGYFNGLPFSIVLIDQVYQIKHAVN